MTMSETSQVLGVSDKEGLELLEDTTAIKITVGCEDKKICWILPKSLLTHHSKFFDAALNGTFAESNSGSMSMPDDNPEVFRVFVQWLYMGDIKIGDVDVWLEAWVLGDKIGNTVFRDCAMTKLVHEHVGRLIDPKTVAFAYRKSVRGSKLRKWALDEIVFESTQENLYSYCFAEDWVLVVETDTDFATDFAKATISVRHSEVEDPRARLDAYLRE